MPAHRTREGEGLLGHVPTRVRERQVFPRGDVGRPRVEAGGMVDRGQSRLATGELPDAPCGSPFDLPEDGQHQRRVLGGCILERPRRRVILLAAERRLVNGFRPLLAHERIVAPDPVRINQTRDTHDR